MRTTWKISTIVVPLVAYLAFGWVVGLVVLDVWLFLRLRDYLCLRRALAPTLLCPRGHEVAQYGVHRCSVCGAVSEGWLWQCVCGAFAGHTKCQVCGLTVWNPLVRE